MGVPGFICTRQKSRRALSRGSTWWKISFLPTETPPVVMTTSAERQASRMASATASGWSGRLRLTVTSAPSSSSRARSMGRLLL